MSAAVFRVGELETLAHLCVTQNGVVEEDAEEHKSKRDNLLPGKGLDAQVLL